MLGDKLLLKTDYNYPIGKFYRYRNIATLNGAQVSEGMTVEYAVSLKLEFIPIGHEKGPMNEFYFKIFKAGTCNVPGLVLGFPQLDFPSGPGDECLGWRNHPDVCEFTALKCEDAEGRQEAQRKLSAIVVPVR